MDYKIIWNLEQLDVTENQVAYLLSENMIYDPRTGDEFDSGEGVYYPEDGVTLDEIETFLTM